MMFDSPELAEAEADVQVAYSCRRAAQRRLAAAMRTELAARYRRNRAAVELLVNQMAEDGYVFSPWQRELIQRHLDAEARRLTGGLVAL